MRHITLKEYLSDNFGRSLDIEDSPYSDKLIIRIRNTLPRELAAITVADDRLEALGKAILELVEKRRSKNKPVVIE
jgi:hypothetical protein